VEGIFNCPKCQRSIKVELETPRTANYRTCSVLTIEHTGEVMCDCGLVVIPVVVSVPEINFTIAVVPPGKEKKLVQPVGGVIT
jgi:hypothetical protein